MKRTQYSIEQIVTAPKQADLIAPDPRPGAAVHMDIINIITRRTNVLF
jgi:hypothetical protein